MFRKFISVFCVVLFPAVANSAPIWPMHAGEVWEFTATPLDGSAPWIAEWSFSGPVTLGSQQYFLVGDTCFRSTDTAIYECEGSGDTFFESIFFQIAPVGTTWSHSTNNTAVILDDNFPVNDENVYGGPYTAYQVQFTDYHGSWYVYVVPGVGPVKIESFEIRPDGDPPNIAILTNIRTVPLPPAVWLFASGLLGLIGVARRKTQRAA